MREMYKNFSVYTVVNAGNFFIVEQKSVNMSEAHKQFCGFERELNIKMAKYSYKRLNNNKCPEIGDKLLFQDNQKWCRCVVMNVIKRSPLSDIRIFLVDYADHRTVQVNKLVASDGLWGNLPAQSKRVSLHGVYPISMKFDAKMNITFGEVDAWDPAANSFIEKVVKYQTSVTFFLVKCSEETSEGHLKVFLRPGCMKEITELASLYGESNIESIELGDLLVRMNFAAYRSGAVRFHETDGIEKVSAKSSRLLPSLKHKSIPSYTDRGEGSSERSAYGNTREEGITLHQSFECSPESHAQSTLPEDHGDGLSHNSGFQGGKSNDAAIEKWLNSCPSGKDSQTLNRKTSSEHNVSAEADSHPIFDCKELSKSLKESSREQAAESCDDFCVIPAPAYISSASPSRNFFSGISLDKSDDSSSPYDKTAGQSSSGFLNNVRSSSDNTFQMIHLTSGSKFNLDTCASHPFGSELKIHAPEEMSVQDKANVEVNLLGSHSGISERVNASGVTRGNQTLSNFTRLSLLKKNKNCSLQIDTMEKYVCKAGLTGVTSDDGFNLHGEKSDAKANKVSDSVAEVNDAFSSGCWNDKFNCDNDDPLDAQRSLYVFTAGAFNFIKNDIITSEDKIDKLLNSKVACYVRNNMKNSLCHLQKYLWPAIISLNSCIAVGKERSGKTFGYIIPILSTLFDLSDVYKKRLSPGVGPIVLVICKDWERTFTVAQDFSLNILKSLNMHIVAAYSGKGTSAEEELQKNIQCGCDVMVTTLPFLVSMLGLIRNDKNQSVEPVTNLRRCCHVVIDDTDCVIEYYTHELKLLIEKWGVDKSKVQRKDIPHQLILLASKWSHKLSLLTEVLFLSLDPTVIISSPSEAALMTNIKTFVHTVQSTKDTQLETVEVLRQVEGSRIMAIVNDEDVKIIIRMLKSYSLNCVSVQCNIHISQVNKLISYWQKGTILLVSASACVHLWHSHVRCADAVVNQNIPEVKSDFLSRYGFMMDNFGINATDKSGRCTFHVVASRSSLATVSYLRPTLIYMKADVPLVPTVAPTEKTVSLCHFIKSFGRCPHQDDCKYRHNIIQTDIYTSLPTAGFVTFEILRVDSASRYFGRLTKYNDGTGNVSLKEHFTLLVNAVQSYYDKSDSVAQCRDAEPGMLCAIYRESQWKRGRIVYFDCFHKMPYTVCLIDFGQEIMVAASEIYNLPDFLKDVPPFIVEILLCKVKPIDESQNWTPEADNYVNNIVSNSESCAFEGKIALALDQTLWLSFVTELSKSGNTLLKKASLRSLLVREGFASDHPAHMEDLQELYRRAAQGTDLRNSGHEWIEKQKKYAEKLNDYINPTSDGDGLCNVDVSYEILEFNSRIPVHVKYVESISKFFVLKAEEYQRFLIMECEIQEMGPSQPVASIRSKYCLAYVKNDKKYYRGHVTSSGIETRTVNLIDTGTTVTLPHEYIRHCPATVISKLPAQGIRCSLAHISVSLGHLTEATEAMKALLSSKQHWDCEMKYKNIDSPLDSKFCVDLIGYNRRNKSDSIHIWKKLLSEGLVSCLQSDKQVVENCVPSDSLKNEVIVLQSVENFEKERERIFMVVESVWQTSSFLQPAVLWDQLLESISLKCQICDVVTWRLYIIERWICFFCCTEDKAYKLEATFYGAIIPDKCSVKVHGLQVNLKVIKETAGQWKKLFVTDKKPHWLHLENPDYSGSESEECSDSGSMMSYALAYNAIVKESSQLIGGPPAGMSDEDVSSYDSSYNSEKYFEMPS